MHYKNRQIVENFRIKANNCYLSLGEYSLNDLKESVINRYNCNSVLKDIVLQEISNIETLIDYLKRDLIYQIKVLEKEQELVDKEMQADDLEKNIVTLTQNLAETVDSNVALEMKKQIDVKTKQLNHLKQETLSLKTIIENMKSAFTSYRIPDINTKLAHNVMYYGPLEVDLDVLESNLSFVKYMGDKFKTEAYNPYIDSDLTEFFEGYGYLVDDAYRLVIDCFKRLYDNLDIYINDCISLENTLIHKLKPSAIQNNDIVVTLNNLPDLESLNLTFSRIIDKANNYLEKEKKSNMDTNNIDNKNKDLNRQIAKSGGLGRREAVVAAATYLSEKVKIPYFYGGRSKDKGFNPDWMTHQKIFKSGSKEQPTGSFQLYGLDNTGFIEWSLNNGGYDVDITDEKQLKPLGETKKFNKKNLKSDAVKAGDILYKSSKNIAIITNINKKKNTIKVASLKNAKEGMVVMKQTIDKFVEENDYDEIILMEKYYNQKEDISKENDNEN